jgi:hypothetical protein
VQTSRNEGVAAEALLSLLPADVVAMHCQCQCLLDNSSDPYYILLSQQQTLYFFSSKLQKIHQYSYQMIDTVLADCS